MSSRSGVGLTAVAAFLMSGSPAPAQQRQEPHRDLEGFERALDRSVRRIGPASAAHPLGIGSSCRGYHLRGYGAVFVLSPRLLPTRGRSGVFAWHSPEFEADISRAMRAVQEGLKRIDSDVLRAQMERSLEALRRTQEAQERALAAAREELRKAQDRRREEHRRPREKQREAQQDAEAYERELHALETEAEAFRREAEKAREDAEKALERALAEAHGEMEALRIIPPAARSGSPVASAAPPLPAAPPSPENPPTSPAEAPPALLPPWSFWFETEDEGESRTPEGLVGEVRDAVTEALETYGARLRIVPPEEFVVVAVDFLPRGAFVARSRPERTLIVRVRKKELDDRQAGKLTRPELRKRIEYIEY